MSVLRRWLRQLGRRWKGAPALPTLRSRVDVQTLQIPGEAWSSREAFLAVRNGAGHERLTAQWQMAQQLPQACAMEGLSGLCPLCAERRRFGRPADAASFDAREGLPCEVCGLSGRMRHALALLVDGLDPAASRVYLTEQASPGFVWLQARFAKAQGSEYGLDTARRARLQRWFHDLGGQGDLRDADITAMADADASLDAIGCFDVLEHVPDYRRALAEFARVLVPGGRLIITVPFIETEQATRVLASLHADGRIEHHAPPEIHGDPVSGGVLCFYHFGWDLLEALREVGFREAEWVRSFAPEYGLFGLWTLRALR